MKHIHNPAGPIVDHGDWLWARCQCGVVISNPDTPGSSWEEAEE